MALKPFKIDVFLTYHYKFKKEKESENIETKKEINIQVVDTKKPVIEGVKNKEIVVGSDINLSEGIVAKDEVDGDVKVQIQGSFDNKKVGVYNLKAVATDKSGNKSEQEFTVTVTNTQKVSTSSTNKSTASKSSNSSAKKTSGSSTKKSSSGCTTSSSTLKKRGYKTSDQNACQKDQQSSAIAKKIASDILAKGYKTDLEKVQAAANAVSYYYQKGVHVEKGLDYRTPYGVFIKGEASCAGCTRALILILEYMGFKNLKHANENGYTHQWVILTMDGKTGFADGQIAMVGYGCHPVDKSCQ